MSRHLKPYRTVRECLKAMARGFVVDEAENNLPKRVVETLLRGTPLEDQLGVWAAAHTRYEGDRPIHYFTGHGSGVYGPCGAEPPEDWERIREHMDMFEEARDA